MTTTSSALMRLDEAAEYLGVSDTTARLLLSGLQVCGSRFYSRVRVHQFAAGLDPRGDIPVGELALFEQRVGIIPTFNEPTSIDELIESGAL